MKYRILGLDLDQTLLDRSGRIPDANRAAIARVQEAGARVVPCTGRAWREAHRVLAELSGLGRGVFVTGAAVCDVSSGRALDLAMIDPAVVRDVVRRLWDLPEAVLVLLEPEAAGCDYLVTGGGALSENTRWWFAHTGASVREARMLTHETLRHALRVGLVAEGARMAPARDALRAAAGDRLALHRFIAVRRPEVAEDVHVLEAFSPYVNKWRGLSWLAAQEGIAPEAVAAIGDAENDLSMLREAGCGIAMGGASPDVRAVADRVTEDCDAAGVAKAVDRLLAGVW